MNDPDHNDYLDDHHHLHSPPHGLPINFPPVIFRAIVFVVVGESVHIELVEGEPG
jgi:hypothetical protein